MEEDLIRFHALYREKVCHKYILLAIEHYATSLRRDMKHVYQALPRLLSLWFDFVSVRRPSSADNIPSAGLTPDYLGEFRRCLFLSLPNVHTPSTHHVQFDNGRFSRQESRPSKRPNGQQHKSYSNGRVLYSNASIDIARDSRGQGHCKCRQEDSRKGSY